MAIFSRNNFDREDILNMVKQILIRATDQLPVKVYLFGSWARREEWRTSDIDVGIWYADPQFAEILTTLRDLLEESLIPYRVDIVDLTQADASLLEKVNREGVLWKDCVNESPSRKKH